MTPELALRIFLFLGLVWTGIWAWVLLSSRHAVAYEEVTSRAAVLRRSLFFLFFVVAVLLFIISMRGLPYPTARAATLGEPQISIQATGMQWAWILSRREIPARVPVEFQVTSRDVNHGFAIYDPQGQLVAQVQAMPGYTNRLIYVFDAPGTYTVRCLEYCGVAHHVMITTLTVTQQEPKRPAT